MKIAFTTLNIFLISAIAYSLISAGYKNLIVQDPATPELYDAKPIAVKRLLSQNHSVVDKNASEVIVKRNLFRVEIEKEKMPLASQASKQTDSRKLEPTQLKLILWGTVTGERSVYAVIEERENRKQALYQIGDSVQGAKLKKILKNQVVLSYQGRDQLLEIQTDLTDRGSSVGSEIIAKTKRLNERSDGKTLSVNQVYGNDNNIFGDLNTIMRQVKFRPHFSQGEADGLMVYGMRPNSVFMKVGLKNGDVIKTVNDRAVISKDDILSQLIDGNVEESLNFTLIRGGKMKKLSFSSSTDKEDE